jgi:hypothetical protein
MGSTVQVMPGPGKSFEAFQADQGNCRDYAASQVKGQAEQSNQRAFGAAVLTTLLGAGLGAAGGAPWDAAGQGAGIGAAAGAATGAAVGANMSANDQVGIQVQYDNAFSQCMFAKGEMVPGYAPPPGTPGPVAYSSGPSGAGGGGYDPGQVRAVQGELIRLGYLQGGADGNAGGRTRTAIRDYEKSNGLPVDGAPSARLLAKLQATPSRAATATAQAPSGWVAPAAANGATPAAATTPAAPANWVAPAKTQ